MKKIFLSLFLLLALSITTSCGLFKSEKEFEKAGIKLTLTNDFHMGEHILVKVFIVSDKAAFMGNYESFSTVGTSTLSAKEYAELVLNANSKQPIGKVEVYEDDNTSFAYAYYEETVEGTDFSYMMVTMVGEERYYCMNFYSETRHF